MYRTIDTKFWTDPKIRKLDANGKLFALYLVTNPHAHLGGIYYLSDSLIVSETGISKRTLDTLWDTLSKLGFAKRDTELEIVWVIKMLGYQGAGLKNLISVSNQLKTLHNSFLCNDFVSFYPSILEVKNGYRTDTLSNGYPEQVSQEQEKEQEKEQEQEREKEQEQNQDHTAKDQVFGLSDENIADAWVFYCTAHAGRSKRDKPNGILPMIRQTLSQGIDRQVLMDAITAKRNRNEWYTDFEKRLLKTNGSTNGMFDSLKRFVERGEDDKQK